VFEDKGAHGAHAELLAPEKNPVVAGGRFFCIQKTDLVVKAGLHLTHGACPAFSGIKATVFMPTPIRLTDHLFWNFKCTH